ncbi:hypothetical protein HYR99_19095 [Candidatus Poribacteria bacterium]|nr:hypothetical protein [Candidatus Poribacteria bacterium]
MRAFEFVAEVDKQHCLRMVLPQSTMPGRVRVLVLVPEVGEDEADTLWMRGVAREWTAELADEREDIYTLEDGEPINAAR